MSSSTPDRSPVVNMREMDGQHRVLFTLIHDLYDVLKFARSNQTIGQFFDEVVEYTKFHFAAEEHLMREIRFPGYLLHKAVHEEVRAQLAELRTRFEEGGRAAVGLAALQFLAEWFVSHIAVEDRAVAAYLNDGLAACPAAASTSIH